EKHANEGKQHPNGRDECVSLSYAFRVRVTRCPCKIGCVTRNYGEQRCCWLAGWLAGWLIVVGHNQRNVVDATELINEHDHCCCYASIRRQAASYDRPHVSSPMRKCSSSAQRR
ncbi:hypothetical protein Tcan_01176, partial [Toxocara canis]